MDLLDWMGGHWWQLLGSTGLGGALLTGLTKGGLWRWFVRQFGLRKSLTEALDREQEAKAETAERTRERDEAIKARDDAYRAAATMRALLEDLHAASALVRQASTLITSDALPNPLAPSSETSPPSPPGSTPSPAPKPPMSIPPRRS